jgi:Fe-S-cluster containining protein
MLMQIDKASLRKIDFLPFQVRLSNLFALMDKKYKDATDYYVFNCSGCKDNCCATRFYHHTLLEYMYIQKGVEALDKEEQIEIKKRADVSVRLMFEAETNNMPFRVMCPLNVDGMCISYDYRPMICRLHGIPHELYTYLKGIVKSPGCDTFIKTCKVKGYYRFDRTPFYTELAELEKDIRVLSGIKNKVKMTVAEMLI